MAYYITCPHCGANLDPGERSDCQDEQEEPNDTQHQRQPIPHPSGDLG